MIQKISQLLLPLLIIGLGASVLINKGSSGPGGKIFVSFGQYSQLVGWVIILSGIIILGIVLFKSFGKEKENSNVNN